MSFRSVGTFDLGLVGGKAVQGGNAQAFAMSDAGIASGQAFLNSELEKRDMMVRTPLTSFTHTRDIPIRVGGGWAEFVSAMQVGYGVTGGSDDGLFHAGGSDGVPMVQADFSKGMFKTHMISTGTRVMWVDMQRGNMTGRNMDVLLRDGLRMTYDKHMEANTYVGFARYETTGLLNNEEVLVLDASATGIGGATTFKSKAPEQILADINNAILEAWEQSEHDRDAIPNHIIMPYEQFNYLATTKVSELAEKTILNFLLENNVARANGCDLFIGATSWCKGAGEGKTDRMAIRKNILLWMSLFRLLE